MVGRSEAPAIRSWPIEIQNQHMLVLVLAQGIEP
jgi:hypothetical protein